MAADEEELLLLLPLLLADAALSAYSRIDWTDFTRSKFHRRPPTRSSVNDSSLNEPLSSSVMSGSKSVLGAEAEPPPRNRSSGSRSNRERTTERSGNDKDFDGEEDGVEAEALLVAEEEEEDASVVLEVAGGTVGWSVAASAASLRRMTSSVASIHARCITPT